MSSSPQPLSTPHQTTPYKASVLVVPLLFLTAMTGMLFQTLPGAQASVPDQIPSRAPTVYEAFELAWSTVENERTTDAAWGDFDGDGALDLVVSNNCDDTPAPVCQSLRLYRNDGGNLLSTAVWPMPDEDNVNGIDVGDFDGDGDLDLAVGYWSKSNRLYRNEGVVNGLPQMALFWSAPSVDLTNSLAWGDYDGDGYLDLAVGNTCFSSNPGCRLVQLYHNDGGMLGTTVVYSVTESGYSAEVAWGDYDNDGALDLAVGVRGAASRLYRNEGGQLATSAVWTSAEGGAVFPRLTWNDYDGDGDSDLTASGRLYRNDAGVLTTQAVWSSPEAANVTDAVWGDYEGDGDLDLALGKADATYSRGLPNQLYRNDGIVDGVPQMLLIWSSNEADYTNRVAFGDYDGDGDLDLAAANTSYTGQQNRLYRNETGGLMASTQASWSSPPGNAAYSVAWGDYDNDGDLDLAFGNGGYIDQHVQLYRNDAGQLSAAPVYSTSEVNDARSVAWGDYDGDGDLDLFVANGLSQPSRLYRNDAGTLTPNAIWSTPYLKNANSAAWGDYDGDSDLDLAVGNGLQPTEVYRNDGVVAGVPQLTPAWASLESNYAQSVAWGDVDDDGDLDLAVGNWAQPNRLYYNNSGRLTPNAGWTSFEADYTASIAWGDYDGDGDLDLAVGNNWGTPNRLYRNDHGILTASAVWTSLEAGYTTSIAWGDFDNDGDYDLVAGNTTQPKRIYQNDKGMLILYAGWSSFETDETWGIGWGDVDNDGDLDLAAGNIARQPSRLYRNARDRQSVPGSIPIVSVQRPGPNADFYSSHRVWSDIIPITYTLSDPQSDPVKYVRAWYSLNGGGQWLPAVAASGTITTNLTTSSTGQAYTYWWDVASSGFFGQSDNVVFRLQAVPAIVTGTHNATPGPYLYGAYASQTFPFRVRGTQVRVLSGTQPISNAIVYRLPAGQSGGGALLADAAGVPFHTDGQGYLQGRGELKLGDQLLALAPVHSDLHYEGVLNLDGIDDYAIKNPLNAAPLTATTVSFWMRSDDHNGQGTPFSYATASDADEFLITNYNNLALYRGTAISVTTGVSVTDGLWHHVAVTWRESDGQVKLYKDGSAVYTGTLTASSLITGGSFVLGQDQGNVGGEFDPARAFKGSLDEIHVWSIALDEAHIQADMSDPLNGDENGLVLAWSFDAPAAASVPDRTANHNDGTLLGAAWNSRSFGGYTVYQTNGVPTEIGVSTHTVTQTGVQTLTVSAARPLILFDLDVSLEWDAHKQTAYLQQLENDLAKTSTYLYDFTNGQVALGQVMVHQNADDWLSSQVAVYATNRLRPLAVQGGLVTEPITDPQRSNITYAPGQVRMGAVWNRYGEPGGDISDWPLALAHELSHYLLYQEDVYLGLNDDGLLIPLNTCTGSVMGDMYHPDNTEFIYDQQHWDTHCSNTLAGRTLDRTEWTTNRLWYPWLITPTLTNAGPSRMPFDLTRITIADPISPTDTLDDPTFYIDYQAGESSSSEARAYIIRSGDEGDYVIDLGSPLGGQNRVYARGAQPDDRLCVFDAARHQYGCEIIELGDERLGLKADTTWRPVVQLTPVNSQTIAIEVSGLTETLPLNARLYPENSFGGEPIALTLAGTIYSGTFHLGFPAMLGHVQIWVDEPAPEDNPRREAMVTYSMGGNPGKWPLFRGGWPLFRGGWPLFRGGWPLFRGGWSVARGSAAPLTSPGGQMLFFTADPTSIQEGNLYTIEGMAGLPLLPSGKTAIGQGYSLIASSNVTQLITGSISFQYLSMDVLAEQADENQLTIHFWDGLAWQALDTVRSPYFNMVSAPNHGPGVYALLAGVTIPHLEAIDPVQAVNDVTTTLTIDGHDFLPPVDVLLRGSTATYTLPIMSVSPISITAIVTPGLPAHQYQVQVVNRYDASFYDASSSSALPFALYDPADACFYDFFESGNGKWQRGGTWDIIILANGNQALTDSPGSSYGVTVSPTLTATTRITSSAFSLSGCSQPVLTFRHDYVIDNRPPSQDWGRIEISTDNGVTWRELARYAGGLRTGLNKATVDSEWIDVQWKDVEIDLSDYTGTVRLRFELEVDRAGADRGWVIDDVMVRTRPRVNKVFLPVVSKG